MCVVMAARAARRRVGIAGPVMRRMTEMVTWVREWAEEADQIVGGGGLRGGRWRGRGRWMLGGVRGVGWWGGGGGWRL